MRADLKKWDMIAGFGGRPVPGIDDLQKILTEEKVGVTCHPGNRETFRFRRND